MALAIGNVQWSNAAVTVLMVAGFAPAAAAMVGRRSDAVETADVPVAA